MEFSKDVASKILVNSLKSQTLEQKIVSLQIAGAETKLDRNYVPFAVYIIQVERQNLKTKELEKYQTQRRFNQFHELDTEVNPFILIHYFHYVCIRYLLLIHSISVLFQFEQKCFHSTKNLFEMFDFVIFSFYFLIHFIVYRSQFVINMNYNLILFDLSIIICNLPSDFYSFLKFSF
jgi:hypothetical protein